MIVRILLCMDTEWGMGSKLVASHALGIGKWMILVSLMGMNPIAVFAIMMGSCAS